MDKENFSIGPERVGRIEPHEYVYGGFEVFGDCGKCGHVKDDPIHKLMPPDPVDTLIVEAEEALVGARNLAARITMADPEGDYALTRLCVLASSLASELAVCRDRADREKKVLSHLEGIPQVVLCAVTFCPAEQGMCPVHNSDACLFLYAQVTALREAVQNG